MGARFRPGRPTARARNLRNEPTNAEARRWLQLKGSLPGGLRFSRQRPIAGYFGDFVCRSARLVVALDGSQHAEAAEYNAARTRTIDAAGYRVLRFWNNDPTTNMAGVLETILNAASAAAGCPPPSPHPPVGGGAEATPTAPPEGSS